MNGQRSLSPRQVGHSSLDALSRTIEGLEARIEGLMGGLPKSGRAPERLTSDQPVAERRTLADRADPLAEIRERQRALEAARPRGVAPSRDIPSNIDDTPPLVEPAVKARLPQAAVKTQPAEADVPDFYQALSSLRADLRQDIRLDISESLAGEIGSLRTEIAEIRKLAEDSQSTGALHEDFSRMAESIERIGQTPVAETQGLRADFDELRSLMDGLVRNDSVRVMEDRWTALEARLETIDPERIQQDLLSLAYRLDEIKQHLGTIGDVRSVRLLEGKLIAIAKALEHIGDHLEPNSQAIVEQFSQLDRRLDEISRAVAAAGRNNTAATDPRLVERLEDRIATIAQHLEVISQQTAGYGVESELVERIEALSLRIEDLANQESARRLEERLDELTAMLDRSQSENLQPELTGYLSDISRKIDALDPTSLSEQLAAQIAVIGRRIDDIEMAPAAPAVDEALLKSLDDRLFSIAARLDETITSPIADHAGIAGLEQQIAHLSALISASPSADGAQGERIEGRMAALEDYLATSDEYIVEAARQAAEAVMENYARQSPAPKAGAAPDQTAETLATLADHLRNLEDISRGGEERSHRTVEALHQTLVQIAEKLDQMDRRANASTNAALPVREERTDAPKQDAPKQKEASPVQVAHREIEAAFQPSAQNTSTFLRAEAHDSVEMADIKQDAPSRPSLLAGLGKRLKAKTTKQALAESVSMPPAPVQDEAPHGRQVMETSPSIDPADALLPDEANELLEPGSGKPDVRKILEKVRARQVTDTVQGEMKPAPAAAKGDDRMDFIAAARRAAQAAVHETDRGSRAQKLSMADEVNSGSAFLRYRRPILMAVGALLLAAMALPLVKGLSSSNATAPTPVAAPVVMNAPAAALPAQKAEQQQLPSETMRDSSAAAPTGPANLSASPIDGGQQLAPLAPAATIAPAPQAGFAAPATAADQASSKLSFDVPAEITPPSLVSAAQMGDPAAMFEIGSRYVEARGVPADFSKAAIWFQRAADQGLAPARYRLAGLYEKGTGVPRDVAKAKGLYLLAAAAGNASAMHNLAVMYASGTDGKTDMQEAAKWFIKAANLGITDSQFNLAVLYARGTGVKQDLGESYKWFALAARDGDKDAGEKRDEVAKAMAPDALDRAKASVEQWQAAALDSDANTVNVPDAWQGKGVTTGSVDMEKAVRNIQAILNKNGFDAGEPDGKLGARTVSAIKAFQTSVGLEPSGKVSNALVKALLAKNA
jgi:localization factor PodJL